MDPKEIITKQKELTINGIETIEDSIISVSDLKNIIIKNVNQILNKSYENINDLINDDEAKNFLICIDNAETFIEIERPKICEVEYIDETGSKKILKCDGLLSTCVQHEINHLDGKLIIDHLSKLKKDFIIKKISKLQKNPDRVIV